MSKRSRFCVLFSDNEDGRPLKTRLLHSDSSRKDLIQIWKQFYGEEEPIRAELVINENCVYRLDDDDDIIAFLAQAEDQYKILPSRPLRVKLVDSRRLAKRRDASLDACIQTALASSKSPVTEESVSKHAFVNCNNNNWRSNEEPSNLKDSSPTGYLQIASDDREPMAPWSTANSLMMLYSKYRHQSSETRKRMPIVASDRTSNLEAVSTPITLTERSAVQTTSPRSPCGNDGNPENDSSIQVPCTQQLASVLFNPTTPVTTSLTNKKHRLASSDKSDNLLCQAHYNFSSAYSSFIKNFQEQRAVQSNPSANYILQTILNNHMRANAPGSEHSLSQRPPNLQFNENSSIINGFSTSPAHSLVPGGSPIMHSMPSTKSSLLSSLANYNSKSLLAYMNGPVFHALQNCTNIDDITGDFSKKTLKKRKRQGLGGEYSKPVDGSKRMRSSVSQSNIEYHYQRALEYSQMKEEEQKLQNSAHRSHWKHLLFVAEISPGFLREYKHAKYDEWSSEARDIYAICQPDKYMWSFLTLSKQGDLLCKRIISRIDDLHNKKVEERPDWCPDEATLHRAQSRARERLGQLQRILYSRSVNQEVKNGSKAHELEKLSIREKNAALAEVYQQRHHTLLQNHGIMRMTELHQSIQGQSHVEQSRHSNAPTAVSGGVRCSSVTSSPISMASPVFEDNSSAGSRCSESHDEQQNNDGLVIAERHETPVCLPTDQFEGHSVSPLPFVSSDQAELTSPQKWSSNMGQLADA